MLSSLVRNRSVRIVTESLRPSASITVRGVAASTAQHAPASAVAVSASSSPHNPSIGNPDPQTTDAKLAPTSGHPVYVPGAPDGFSSSSPWAKYGPGYQFWKNIPSLADVTEEQFLSHAWNQSHTVDGKLGLERLLEENIRVSHVPIEGGNFLTKQEFIEDMVEGMSNANMAVRMSPYIVSRVNWDDPAKDPVLRQYTLRKSLLLPDHPKANRDSLDEKSDSKIPNLVHRYPDKVLFLVTMICPAFCNYCTRARAVGWETEAFSKEKIKSGWRHWTKALEYVRQHPDVTDVVVSGGDCFYLPPESIQGNPDGKRPEEKIGLARSLLDIPHVRRIRFATKGLAVAPARFIDRNDPWTNSLIWASNYAKDLGKTVALHTHFNHPSEFTWMSAEASQRLNRAGLLVRNQSVLLRGVNDTVETMSTLIRVLADNNVIPYYVYQCDMLPHIEHFRTDLNTNLHIAHETTGSIAGFSQPKFVVDLPGGGGKRPIQEYLTYDRATGRSTFTAPAITSEGKSGKVYEYWDPVHFRPNENLSSDR
ncbi:L-lysine 2,3-aminomutase [Zalerion maritima]|uniref:L-lysine 2,3-aminomutase n=1 Tax=Zalerion maritima TaxID=339359 RepID=A0AAD5RFJ5_9PEZI|nr:L-lysine 2,3-aminomutase [Zalerion maritima]